MTTNCSAPALSTALSLLATRTEETAALRRGAAGAAGDRGRAALRAAQAGARGHSGRRLRRDRRFRPGARRQHRHHPAQRGLSRAALRPHHPAARQHHAHARHLRRWQRDLGAPWWRRATPTDLTADGEFPPHALARDRPLSRRRPDRATAATLDARSAPTRNLLEEMKADLVSLFAGAGAPAARLFHRRASCARIYASGILRTLQNEQAAPRAALPDDAADAVQLVPRRGVLSFDRREAAADASTTAAITTRSAICCARCWRSRTRRRGRADAFIDALEQLGRGTARAGRGQHARPAALSISAVHLRCARRLERAKLG